MNMNITTNIKSNLDNKKVAEILSFMGYEITRDYKFVNNPSISISRDGYIKDFGSTDFRGDIFDFLIKEKNISLSEAIKFVADCLGVSYE
jgi:hypothetical protein